MRALSNNVLQLTAPACHGPGYTLGDMGAATGRTGVGDVFGPGDGQGRASPARS